METTSTKLPKNFNPSVIKAAIRERLALQSFKEFREDDFKITHISKVEGQESWDAIYLSAGTEVLAEIKVRDKNYKDWDHEGWILEEYKYNALKALQIQSKRPIKIMYINVFKDAVILWDLDEVKPIFRIRNCKVMTVQNKGKIDKSVALLFSSEGTVYLKENNIEYWNKQSEDIFKFLFPQF